MIPCTRADTFCTGRQTLCVNFVPASSTASSAPVRIRSARTSWPRSRSEASVKTRSTFWACARARYTTCAASATISEIFGCVSSSRICTRLRIGLSRDSRSEVNRSMRSVVRRIWRNMATRIPACSTIAAAATQTKTAIHISIRTPSPLRMGSLTTVNHQTEPAALKSRVRRQDLRLGFAQVRFASRINGRRNRILFAHRDVLAALDQFIRALAELPRLALREVAPFIGFLGEQVARLFAGLGRKQNADKRANTEAYEEISHLGSHIVRHSKPPQKT